MISGTYILTDTIDKAFSNLFTQSYAGTDAVVQGEGPDISIDGAAAPTPPVDASLLETVRGVDEVALATGGIYDETNTKILQPDGDAVSTGGAPSFGFGIDTDPQFAQFNPLNLLEGRWPSAPDEVVIDAGTADGQGYALGDTVEIATLVPKRAFELVGVAQYGGMDSLGTATFAVFTIPTAQELLDREGQYDAISVAANEGTSEEELVSAIQSVLPAGVTAQTATAGDRGGAGRDRPVHVDHPLLPARRSPASRSSSALSSSSTPSRSRSRSARASSRRCGRSARRAGRCSPTVILESLVIGIVASLIGLALGLLLAEGIQALFGTLGFELPTAERVFALRTVIVSMLVGVLVTLAAGLFPAIRATRVPPIAAVREGATLPRSRISPFVPWIAGLVVVGALLLLGRAMFTDDLGTADRLIGLAGGVLLLFVGIAMLSSRLVAAHRRARRLPGASDRRRGGEAGEREHGAQPGQDRRDGRRADDRDRARRLHRDPRERPEDVEPGGDRGAGLRRLRHHGSGRLHAVPGRGRRRRGRLGRARGRVAGAGRRRRS